MSRTPLARFPAPFRLGLAPLLLALALLLTPGAGSALETAARAALVVDAETGARLLEKNAQTPIPPASMSKLMTLNLVFEALADGRLDLDDRFRVSARAARMGGSKMFTREGDSIRIEDLIRGVIVQSGNDACVVLAEGLAGTETAFARRMTERARELGMMDSVFANSTGWPDPRGVMSPNDLVFIARRIITEFPQYYGYFAETEFTWAKITQKNRNPLLYLNIGADGLKTGHTAEAGYGLVGSATRGDRRVILMLGGLSSVQERSVEAERLMDWAFREFANETLYASGQVLGAAEVWLGASAMAPLTVAEDVRVTLPYAARGKVKAEIFYEGPVEAPIAKGQRIAELRVSAPGMAPMTIPVVAAKAVDKGNYLVRLQAAAGLLLRQAIDAATQAAGD